MSTVIEICPSMSEFNNLKDRVTALETKTIKGAATSSTSHAFNANAVVNAYSLSLEAGLWVALGWLTISPNSACEIQLMIGTSSTSWTQADRTDFNNATTGIYQTMAFFNFNSTTTIYLNMRCTVAGNRSYGGLSALKVK